MTKLSTALPANLPENWTYGQIIAPTGQEVGLPANYGYNYLMSQVNNAQRAALELEDKKAEVDMSNISDPSVALYHLGAKPNDNLIDNWDFTNPINQKGVTTGNTEWSIMFDRWKQFGGQWTLTSQGLQMKLKEGSSYWSFLQQSVVNVDSLAEKTATFSILIDRKLYYETFVLKKDDNVGFTMPLNTFEHVNIHLDSSTNILEVQYYGATATRTIQAIKLELGYKQTLARKTDTGYEQLEHADPMIELLKCQRYSYVCYNVNSCYPASMNGTAGIASVNTPVKMVKVPVFNLKTGTDRYGVIYSSSGAIGVSAVSISSYVDNIANLTITSVSSIVSNVIWRECEFSLDTGM